MAGGLAPLRAPGDRAGMAEQGRPAGVDCQPFFEHFFEEWRQGHAAGGPLAPAPLLLPYQNRVPGEIHVRNQCPQYLRPPGAGVGGEAEQRENPRVASTQGQLISKCLSSPPFGKLQLHFTNATSRRNDR